MVLSETIHVVLPTHGKFRQFTPRPVADARRRERVLLCLPLDGRAEIDAVVERAVAEGGRADPGPPQDHGFMASRGVEDPDGRIWELMWMDPAALPPGAQAG